MPNLLEQLRRDRIKSEVLMAKVKSEAANRRLRLLRGDMSALPNKEIQELSRDESELPIKSTKNILGFILRKNHRYR